MMKRKNKNVLLMLLFFLSFWSCISEYTPEGLDSLEGILVVEGAVIAPYGTSFKISRTRALSDKEEPIYEKEAVVRILKEDGSLLAQAVDSAEYFILKEELILSKGEKCAVQIVIGSKTYQSEFVTLQAAPSIDEVGFSYKELTQLDIYVSTHDSDPTGSGFYRWLYEEDWEIRSNQFSPYLWEDNVLQEIGLSSPDNRYYCWKQQHSNQFLLGNAAAFTENQIRNQVLIQIPKSDSRFSYLYSVLIKQHALDRKGFEYFQNLQKNIDNQGGLFAPQPVELKGNIVCLSDPIEPVIGYIYASTESAERLFIAMYEYPDMEDLYNCTQKQVFGLTDAKKAYESGYGIIEKTTKELIGVNIRCVDCTKRGGTKQKPDFWPNDHQ